MKKLIATLAALLPLTSFALNIEIVENSSNRLVFDVKNYGVGNDIQIKTGVVISAQADGTGFDVAVDIAGNANLFRHSRWAIAPVGFTGAKYELIATNGQYFWRYTYNKQ